MRRASERCSSSEVSARYSADQLREILTAPPVPRSLCDSQRLVNRYWRGMKALGAWDEGKPVKEIAATLGVSPSTVLRDLRWLVDGGLVLPFLRPKPRPLPPRRSGRSSVRQSGQAV
jgi:DNA-binding transcriptional ArsR family regulator